jgi:CRP-like cAMP-binding protein
MTLAPFSKDIQYLQQIRFFQGINADELTAIAQVARLHRVEHEAFFFHQNDPTTAFFILTQGQVKLTQVTPEGHQVLVRFIRPGEGFGIIAALSNIPYPLSAEAVGECVALAWNSETLARLLERYPRLALNALRLVAGRFKELQDRYRELATERVERRIARALLRLTRQTGRKVEGGVLLDLPLSRQDLAEMTGTTLYTVSRILSQWDQQGIIEAGRERVLIRSPHDLVAIAEDLPPGSRLESLL